MIIPFVKAHGAGNDFLFTFAQALAEPVAEDRHAELARALCNRHTGVGGDGWYLILQPSEGHHAEIRLHNSDGSKAELSGNGSRCAAAILLDAGLPAANVRLLTGAGPRQLRLIERKERRYRFEMDMGKPVCTEEHLRFALPLGETSREVTILDVGNPQCAVVVESFDSDWRAEGAVLEKHEQFPNGANVSFVRKVDERTIEARFWERGAGATLSSGTGATGAAAAAILLRLVASPVRVITEAGDLEFSWDNRESPARLTGDAQITARGEFFW